MYAMRTLLGKRRKYGHLPGRPLPRLRDRVRRPLTAFWLALLLTRLRERERLTGCWILNEEKWLASGSDKARPREAGNVLSMPGITLDDPIDCHRCAPTWCEIFRGVVSLLWLVVLRFVYSNSAVSRCVHAALAVLCLRLRSTVDLLNCGEPVIDCVALHACGLLGWHWHCFEHEAGYSIVDPIDPGR